MSYKTYERIIIYWIGAQYTIILIKKGGFYKNIFGKSIDKNVSKNGFVTFFVVNTEP